MEHILYEQEHVGEIQEEGENEIEGGGGGVKWG